MNEQELLYAIFAMDTYNREYEEGIVVSGNEVGSTAFRNYRALGISDATFAAWQAAGFYASAYTLTDGTTVISYRGTNAYPDYIKGWSIALGLVSDYTQAPLALEFYNTVTGTAGIQGPAENVAPDTKTTASVIANFKQVVKDGALKLHPIIARLIDAETLK